jgi:DNA polymerase epsilon subunit 1
MYGLFFPVTQKAHLFVVDTVRSNQMPNLNNMYKAEHSALGEEQDEDDVEPPGTLCFIIYET